MVWCTRFPAWTAPEHMLVRLVGHCPEEWKSINGQHGMVIQTLQQYQSMHRKRDIEWTGMKHIFWTHAIFSIPNVCWYSGIYTDNTIQSTESVDLYVFFLVCQLDVCYLFFPSFCIYCQPDVCCMPLLIYVLHWCQMFLDIFRLVFASHCCHVALHLLHVFFVVVCTWPLFFLRFC